MISVRWRPSSWMQFSTLFLKSSWHGPTTDDRSDEFPDGSLPSNHSTYGVCECKHVISNTPKGKNHMLKDRESEGATVRLWKGNEVPGKHVSNNGHWLVCSVHCGTILLKVANPEEKNADHLVPPNGPPTEYYLFKICQVPVGHPVQVFGRKECANNN